jgi:hypothetical protein
MNDVNKDAGGGNRTPTTYRSTDFHTRHGFRRRQWRLESGLSLHHGPKALGAARLVSTPSPRGAWLGIAVGRTGTVSPNLSGSTPPVSRRALHQSLLRLPVSPRPRVALLAVSDHGSK